MPSAIAPRPALPSSRRARLTSGLIWAFCLLLVAGSWWLVLAQIRFERDAAMEDAIRQNENRTIAFEQYVRRTLEGADLATRYIAERYQRGAAGAEFSGTPDNPARLRGDIARERIFLAVIVTDERGHIVATSIPQAAGPLPNVASRPAFRVHVQGNGERLFISRPFDSRFIRRQVIWFSRRLEHPDGSFAGIVAVSFAPTQFTDFARDAAVDPRDVMAVIGLDGIVRARRIGNVADAGLDLSNSEIVRQQQINPNPTFIAAGPDGIRRIYSERRLRNHPLFVSYGVPEARILAPPRARARIFIAGVAVLTAVLIAFAALLTLQLNRRERREAEMTQANSRLEEAQRIGQIGDWFYDLRTGETFWSPQLLAMYERRGLASPSFDEFLAYLDEDGRAAIQRAHAAATRTGEAQEVEYAVHLPSGAESYHQSAVIPTKDASGKVVRLHGTDQNISARKLLDLLQTHVAHLSRVEAMNAMAATLAHELNQPLTSAANYLVGSRGRLRSLDGQDAEQVAQGIAAAERQVHLAADIIRRVREMLSNQPKTLVAVSLTRIVDDAAALVAMASPDRSFAVDKKIAANARTAKGDRIQLQQVMINLLRNACDATEGLSDPEIVVSTRRDGRGPVTVCVEDNGPGFSQPASERFSPFATTKRAGLGLGLSISRTIIEAHGGRIWTEDRDEGGARICFTLPAARRRQEASDEVARGTETV